MNKWILEKIISASNRLLTPIRRQLFSQYSTESFEIKHLANCKSLPTRIDLLHHLPKNAVVAEIGVSNGDFAEQILRITNPEKLILIDLWNTRFAPISFMEDIKIRFQKEIASGQVELRRGDVMEIINEFDEEFFDWVYIDSDHRLEQITEELKVIPSRIKRTGIISGHDYSQGNWIGGIRYGIKEAVRSFCIQEDWEMIYLTHELRNEASFAIRRIQV